jgi:hypothetical protein
MSDEPQPLRLKPRLKVDPAASSIPKMDPPAVPAVEPAPSAAPAPVAETPPAPAPAPEKPRLKPRLSLSPEPAATLPPSATRSPIPVPPPAPEVPPEPAPAPVPVAEVAPPPAPVPAPAPAPTGEPGKFKLKPKPPAPPAPVTMPVVVAVPTPVAEPASVVTGSTPPMAEPVPVESAPAEELVAGDPTSAEVLDPTEGEAPAAPKLKGRPPGTIISESPSSPIPLPANVKKRGGKKRTIMIAAAGVLLLGGIGFYAYATFFSEPPAPSLVVRPKPPVPKAEAPAAPKTAGTAPIPATSTAGKAVEKAQASIAGRTADGKAAVPETIDDRAPAAPNLAAPPVQGSAAPSTAEVKVAAGITATTKGVDSTPDASPAFRSWVVNARITGVRAGGNNPAATINGRLISRGGTIDDALGVILDNIDSDKKVLIFRDKTGAIVSRPYF